jgi:hypothetical protein
VSFFKENVMALSDDTKKIIVVALANKTAGNELSAAVDAGTAGAEDAEAFADDASDSADAAAASAADAEAAADAIDAAATAVADLNQTISDPPTQAEVQAISDKVDELLAALRAIA